MNDESKNPRRPPDPAEPESGRTPSPDDEEYERRSDPRVPFDAPEADVLEQSQSWGDDEVEERPRIPDDAPEADVLEQSQPGGYDDHDRRDD